MSAPDDLESRLTATRILVAVGADMAVELRTVVIDRAECGLAQLADALIDLGADMSRKAETCRCVRHD